MNIKTHSARLALPSFAFVSFLSVLLVGGCAGTPFIDLVSGNNAPVASDFCPEVVELVDEFNSIAIDGYLSDDSMTLDNMASSAEKMSALVNKATSEGVDFSDADAMWLKNLGLSADSFVILAQAGPDTFSDDELRGYLERIIGWYDVAAEECRVVIAQSRN